MTKVIGIPAWRTSTNTIGITVPYLRFISNFGVPRVILPNDAKSFDPDKYDMILLPGGPDVNPERYGETPDPDTGNACLYKEYFDKYILPKVVEANVPIFGICRGEQTLNVFFGGKLEQHINVNKHGLNGVDRTAENHEIQINQKAVPKRVTFTPVIKVNSIHHQVISEKTLSPEFNILATHKIRRKHVEAIIHQSKPIIAVQWHPEELDDNFSKELIHYLLTYKQNESKSTEKFKANLEA